CLAATNSSSRGRVLSWPPTASLARCTRKRSNDEDTRLLVEREGQRVARACASVARRHRNWRADDDDQRARAAGGDACGARGAARSPGRLARLAVVEDSDSLAVSQRSVRTGD